MQLFDVYSPYNVEPVSAKGCTLYDSEGKRYLDFYSGHAVVSIGHGHPCYVEMLKSQLAKIGFYSNAVLNSLQQRYANKLGALSGYDDYALFLCNSGAEANENALKLASFKTGRKRMLAFNASFHGRTSGALAVTDIASYQSPFNHTNNVSFVPLNNIAACETELSTLEYAAVIIEGIQGVGGIREVDDAFLQQLQQLCHKYGTMLILDEVQSGCGRTGCYFAHQHAGIRPDIISMAKGIGNGFPMAAILISPKFEAVKNQLGTTFGGSHLACIAGIAVADVMQQEKLMENAYRQGYTLQKEIKKLPGVKEIRGRGLMLGVEMEYPAAELRNKLLFDYQIFTGSSGTNTIRLLPPLCVSQSEVETLLTALKTLTKA